MTASWMPSLPESKWNIFCMQCMRGRRLDFKTELQHSEMHPDVVSATCPCKYIVFAEQTPYTVDQIRQIQTDAARAALTIAIAEIARSKPGGPIDAAPYDKCIEMLQRFRTEIIS